MPFDKKVRTTIYNLVVEALRAKPYFKAVKAQLPESQPSGLDDPQAFVALLPELIEGITNKERESNFRLAVILFVRAEEDVDLAKLEALDEAEQAINNLQTSADFTAIASLIHVQNVDHGPLSLSVFGLDWSIMPPFGVTRIDVNVNFIYPAID